MRRILLLGPSMRPMLIRPSRASMIGPRRSLVVRVDSRMVPGKPIAALVRIDPVALEGWIQASAGDPPIGQSLEESPAALRAAARPIAYGERAITGLS